MRGVGRVLIFVLSVSLLATGVGCGVLRRRAAAKDDGFVEDMRHGRRPMGQVVVVDAEKGFVLVQSPLATVTPADSTLVVKARDTAATTGKLKVTPERKKNRIAADIVEGSPKIGEVVFFQSEEKVVSTSPPVVDPGSGGMVSGPSEPVVAGGGPAGVVVPDGMPPSAVDGAGGASGELPPLGEPSGPREMIPEFPGLEPLPRPGGAPGEGPGELPEPIDPAA
jgi:hypothetical protein